MILETGDQLLQRDLHHWVNSGREGRPHPFHDLEVTSLTGCEHAVKSVLRTQPQWIRNYMVIPQW